MRALGGGSTNHLSAVLFEKAAGIQMLHVPYKGGAPAVLDTVSNQTQVLFSAGILTLPHVKAGKLNLLAVTEAKRSSLLPQVPDRRGNAAGLRTRCLVRLVRARQHAEGTWSSVSNEAANEALADTAIRTRMEAIGVEIVQGTPQQFSTVLRRDADRYGKVIRDLNIKAD